MGRSGRQRDGHRHGGAFRSRMNENRTVDGLGHEPGKVEAQTGARATAVLLKLIESTRKKLWINSRSVVSYEVVERRVGRNAHCLHRSERKRLHHLDLHLGRTMGVGVVGQ